MILSVMMLQNVSNLLWRKCRMKHDYVLYALILVLFLFSIPKLVTTYRVLTGKKCKEWATRYTIIGAQPLSSFNCKEWE